MDIGGGSVEFIIADREKVFWQQSFPIGVAVLFRRFHHSDPISDEEIGQEEHFLDASLSPLWQALGQWPADVLIGASGTFDVIDNFLLDTETKPPLYGQTTAAAFEPLCDYFIQSSLAERREMPLLAPGTGGNDRRGRYPDPPGAAQGSPEPDIYLNLCVEGRHAGRIGRRL